MPKSAVQESATDATKSVVQNISEIEFEEGRPWSQPVRDQSQLAFEEHLHEAESLERQITDIESTTDQLLVETKGRLAPLQTRQIVVCFTAWKLVADGKVPASAIDEYALNAGIKAHGNEKIPCSRPMRAIVLTGVINGTKPSKHKLARASTYASAIDYGIREGMTEEQFVAELEQPRKQGERHGIEHLAALGRKARQTTYAQQEAEHVAQRLNGLWDGGGFLVSGDFTDVQPGYRLVVIDLPAETTVTEVRGQIIDPVDEALVRRLLRTWIRARAAAEDGNATTPSAQSEVTNSIRELANTVNSMRLM